MKSFKQIAQEFTDLLNADCEKSSAAFADELNMIDMFESDRDHGLYSVVPKLLAEDGPGAADAIMHQDTSPREDQGRMIAQIDEEFFTKYMVPEGWIDWKDMGVTPSP